MEQVNKYKYLKMVGNTKLTRKMELIKLVRKIANLIVTYTDESWIITEKQNRKLMKRNEGKTRRDKIRNALFRANLRDIPMEATIEEG